jgi:hypothetical protein
VSWSTSDLTRATTSNGHNPNPSRPPSLDATKGSQKNNP